MASGAKTGGRKKGTPNHVTAGAKSNVMAVFEMLGGAKGFAEWASENKTEFYRHYAKLIPSSNELSGPDGSAIPVGLNVTFR